MVSVELTSLALTACCLDSFMSQRFLNLGGGGSGGMTIQDVEDSSPYHRAKPPTDAVGYDGVTLAEEQQHHHHQPDRAQTAHVSGSTPFVLEQPEADVEVARSVESRGTSTTPVETASRAVSPMKVQRVPDVVAAAASEVGAIASEAAVPAREVAAKRASNTTKPRRENFVSSKRRRVSAAK